jgi:CDP-diacylglycerol--glycerol-3-phosphate 3-phosphatidyltransferase
VTEPLQPSDRAARPGFPVQAHRPALPGPLADNAAGSPVAGVPLLNIANALTVGRLLLVPVVLALLAVGGGHAFGWRIGSGVAFGVASITDRFDGELARRRHLVTTFGKLADPIADKALTGSALIALSVVHDLPWWLTGIVLARELAVTALRFFVIRHGVIPASRGGKLKTLLQGVAIGLYLLPLGAGPMGVIRAVLLGLAVAVTLITGADYVGRATRLRRSSPRTALAREQREAAEAAISAAAANRSQQRRRRDGQADLIAPHAAPLVAPSVAPQLAPHLAPQLAPQAAPEAPPVHD